MIPTPNAADVHITLSGDIYLKSRRTQKGLIRRARANLDRALASVGYAGSVDRLGNHRYTVHPDDELRPAVIDVASQVFGVGAVDTVVPVPFESFDGLVEAASALTESRVVGKTFAVRVKRRGAHDWKSPVLASAVGTRLVEAGGTVDLSDPQETVNISVLDQRAFVVIDHASAPGGLPLGTQEKVLCLISGGFDSVVAAWMMMSRGCPVDYVHFTLNCAQSDHALAVAREMWSMWGFGTQPTVHLVEFQPVKDALFDHVEPRMRQIALKVMMAKAASTIAEAQGIEALVTGDALGQVSSQTLPHLVGVSREASTPILRPLLGLPKQQIIDLARVVGTAELSARAQEVCDLSEGRRVATAARQVDIGATVESIPEDLMRDAVTTKKSFQLSDWTPGQF